MVPRPEGVGCPQSIMLRVVPALVGMTPGHSASVLTLPAPGEVQAGCPGQGVTVPVCPCRRGTGRRTSSACEDTGTVLPCAGSSRAAAHHRTPLHSVDPAASPAPPPGPFPAWGRLSSLLSSPNPSPSFWLCCGAPLGPQLVGGCPMAPKGAQSWGPCRLLAGPGCTAKLGSWLSGSCRLWGAPAVRWGRGFQDPPFPNHSAPGAAVGRAMGCTGSALAGGGRGFVWLKGCSGGSEVASQVLWGARWL